MVAAPPGRASWAPASGAGLSRGCSGGGAWATSSSAPPHATAGSGPLGPRSSSGSSSCHPEGWAVT
eukprot:1833912-Lingulodinium_polyedra.AAC.1